MSNKTREVVPKKALLIEIRNLREALSRTNESLQEANNNLASLEESYTEYKRKVKTITEKSLFLGLFAAFRLWKGDRRF